jgi:hypothetical protein
LKPVTHPEKLWPSPITNPFRIPPPLPATAFPSFNNNVKLSASNPVQLDFRAENAGFRAHPCRRSENGTDLFFSNFDLAVVLSYTGTGIFEHGIFHGIINWQENKSLKIKYKNGLFTIEWE